MYPRCRGFTLVELMITVVIVAIGVALAVPSWENAVQKRNVTSAAEEIAAFISHAKSEAIKRNEGVTVSLTKLSATNWCVGAVDQTQLDAVGHSHCGCSAPVGNSWHCSIDGESQYMSNSRFGKTIIEQITSNGTVGTTVFFEFDPIRGTKTDFFEQELMLVTENTNFKLQVEVSPTGRVVICNPVSAKKVPGFKACT